MAQAPLHRAVFTAIQDRIFSGEWTEGAPMPTEMELCTLFGVSRITVRRALDELARLGLVERIRGRGTFIHAPRLRSGDANLGFLDAMRERGAAVTTKLLHAGLEEIGEGTAASLRMSGDEPRLAWHFRRLRSVDGIPLAIMNSFVPRWIGDMLRDFDLEKESFYRLYARVAGSPVARTEGHVSAIIPDPEACALLCVPEGSAHLWYRSIGYLGDGRPVETSYSIFNASRYEFSVTDLRPGAKEV